MGNTLKLEDLLKPDCVPDESAGGENWRILHGDTLKLVKGFQPGIFDAVITDPPYASGGTKQNERNRTTNQKYSSMKAENALPDFDGDNKDQRSWTHWMTALVGPSGSGKSTIANLLARLWDVKSGNVTIRGVDIRNVPLSELMDQISMVFQRVYLFQDTIYNNIIMGKPDATEEEVYEAARKARCYDFIMALPDGFQTVVGEGGATLSGGEKQRISIARCILKDAPIVILDEATASVDTDNESYIQEAISELVKGKTLLVIAHRLNTIQNADQILVIDNGQIAQQGTHEELLKQPGIYQDFVNIRKSAAGWSLA